MAKHKTITVNQLYKMMGELIESGEGRRQVCIDKTTFAHNCESDGCVILQVDGCRVQDVIQMQDDSFIDDTGNEHYKRCVVLFGGHGTGYLGVLSTDAVERYIRDLKWSDGTSGIFKTLITRNIRAFASEIRERTSKTW